MIFKCLKLKKIDSTNNEAIRLIKTGKTKPQIILTSHQTKGRGRYGKKWVSIKGNLYMSLFFEINKSVSLKKITKINCDLVKKSIKKFVKNVKVKLPNDILIEKKKICGILQETIMLKGRKFIIIGIGVNIKDSPKNLKYDTSFINEHTNKKISRMLVYNTIKRNFEKKCDYVLSR